MRPNFANVLSCVFLNQGVLFYILYPPATSYLIYLYRAASLQFKTNQIFPITYAFAIILLIFVYMRLSTVTTKIRALVFAIPFPFAATSFFEQTYQTIGYFELHFPAFSVSLQLSESTCLLY